MAEVIQQNNTAMFDTAFAIVRRASRRQGIATADRDHHRHAEDGRMLAIDEPEKLAAEPPAAWLAELFGP